jgi:hypothetical protein
MGERRFAEMTGIDYGQVVATNLVRFFAEGGNVEYGHDDEDL